MAAFVFFGGVPRSILYGNTKLAVARILGDGTRQRTRVFSALPSHCLFEDRFGRPGKGNDKGKVEGLIGTMRRNLLVPIPRVEPIEILNARLAVRCGERQAAKLRRHEETIAQRLERNRAAFLALPAAPYDACDRQPGRVTSLSLVRYKANDYSMPLAYGHCEVLIRGYVGVGRPYPSRDTLALEHSFLFHLAWQANTVPILVILLDLLISDELRAELIYNSTLRYCFWKIFVDYDLNNPLIGEGYFLGPEAYDTQQPTTRVGDSIAVSDRFNEAHNIISDVFGEMGILAYGLLAFVGRICLLATRAGRAAMAVMTYTGWVCVDFDDGTAW